VTTISARPRSRRDRDLATPTIAVTRDTVKNVSTWVGLWAVGIVLVMATALGFALNRRSGRFRDSASTTPLDPLDPRLAGLGVRPGTPLTLLQFSSAFCGPCRATRILCADVAARVPGVHHIEVDAESHLDAVRALDIWRTPTVLLVDAAGVICRRATGAPSRAQLLAAVADVLPAEPVAP
jgi:thiol-disulfide isomerase/thioredoxin